jgi:hypothetical protein
MKEIFNFRSDNPDEDYYITTYELLWKDNIVKSHTGYVLGQCNEQKNKKIILFHNNKTINLLHEAKGRGIRVETISNTNTDICIKEFEDVIKKAELLKEVDDVLENLICDGGHIELEKYDVSKSFGYLIYDPVIRHKMRKNIVNIHDKFEYFKNRESTTPISVFLSARPGGGKTTLVEQYTKYYGLQNNYHSSSLSGVHKVGFESSIKDHIDEIYT